MKQRDINFKVKNYMFKDQYKNDGCPTLYFEFNKHEYYGLVSVKINESEYEGVPIALVKGVEERAYQVYLETVGGESIKEIKQEGYATQISKSEALLKFLLAEDGHETKVGDLLKQFEECENGCLLVDSSLL
ncbi:hypothetical protein ON064_04035 [Planococcus sp. A6]|uniref:hypothetical protein n=1 Tax=Planococcus sp. A6 TaxID=2992760 RepID=UPI00237BAA6F|nr:hypothetical protein [Planococcus sp. A6]MDE0582215.1 hypothetical protein [Planococcus sp. A6]